MNTARAQDGLFTVYLDKSNDFYLRGTMSQPQITITLILGATIILFVWGKWRHDIVALSALLACVLTGLVPSHQAFSGFAHPAVITVAAILVLSRALQTSGAVDALTRWVLPRPEKPELAVASLVILAAFLSAFMNNVGALALLMPIGIQMAKQYDLPIGHVLMPLAFGSILGGMTTLIGTPPNLIVAGFREDTSGTSFTMFDFAPVGLAVTLVGLAFVLIFGRWLIPARTRSDAEDFDTGHYLTEALIPAGSKSIGLRIHEAEEIIESSGAQVVALIRGGNRLTAPHGNTKLREDDTLVIEAEPKPLMQVVGLLGLEMTPPPEASESNTLPLTSDQTDEDEQKEALNLMEVVVMPTASIIGRSALSLRLRARYGVNILAISRQGHRTVARLRSMRFRPSDVLLMQGPTDQLQEFAFNHGCVPLADRSLRVPKPAHAWLAALTLLGAVVGAAFGLLPAAITFCLGSILLAVTGVLAIDKIYTAIDWPVVILLGALIPVAQAMSTTGLADLLANGGVALIPAGTTWMIVIGLMVITMTLSDFMNNAATAAVMCPVALSAATSLGIQPEPALMAVAIGASCAFLTPIGHQNNTLILSPGGFRFGDFWRLGLPLEALVVATATPMILLIWPP